MCTTHTPYAIVVRAITATLKKSFFGKNRCKYTILNMFWQIGSLDLFDKPVLIYRTHFAQDEAVVSQRKYSDLPLRLETLVVNLPFTMN